jgi:hypothetical protein
MKSLTSKTPLPKFQRLPSLLKLPPYTDLSALFITGLPPYSNFLQPFPLLSSSSPFPAKLYSHSCKTWDVEKTLLEHPTFWEGSSYLRIGLYVSVSSMILYADEW